VAAACCLHAAGNAGWSCSCTVVNICTVWLNVVCFLLFPVIIGTRTLLLLLLLLLMRRIIWTDIVSIFTTVPVSVSCTFVFVQLWLALIGSLFVNSSSVQICKTSNKLCDYAFWYCRSICSPQREILSYFKVCCVRYGFLYWWQSQASSELEFEVVKCQTVRSFH